nr:hypothetical protein [uncultured Kingella sp.]
MKKLSVTLISLMLVLTLSTTIAKGKNINQNLSDDTLSVWHDDNGKSYPIRKNPNPNPNPNPKERYELNISMPDAPDNLIMTHAFAYYWSDCEIIVNKRAGANAKLKETIPIPFEKTGEHTYRAVAYNDAILSERYSDAGPECKWNMHFIVVRLQAEPNLEKIIYEAISSPEDVYKINNHHWQRILYMTKYNFNVPYKDMSESRKKIMLPGPIFEDKDRFAGKPREHLFSIVMDLKRK